MAERLVTWLSQSARDLLAWFEHLSGWLQLVIVVALILFAVAMTHLDELARQREWHEFKCWRESQRKTLKGIKP